MVILKNDGTIKKLTLQEKAFLLSGSSTWETYGIKNIVPKMFLADGPHGIRKQLGAADHLGLNQSELATCFPTAATLANSWDEQLLAAVGAALGDEAKKMDVQVVLGPGLNIKRNPKCGRNFEYYSEDPFLAGKMAAASIRGIQKNGTIACPKHFAVNSQEYRRMASDSIVDPRTFREIYTTAFEIAVKEGHPQAIMSSYNLINGTYANENQLLLQKILRQEWGFTGMVVSDWGGDNSHVAGVQNGSHLAMPSLGNDGANQLIMAVKRGQLAESVLDERVDELLTVIKQSTAGQTNLQQIDWQGHQQIAKEAAMKSIVLLKNKDQVLPLNSQEKIALIGQFVRQPRYQGSGSSMVNTKNLETTEDLFADYPLNVIGYARGYDSNNQNDPNLASEALALVKQSEVILLYAGLDDASESEGIDRNTLSLPQNQLDLIEQLSHLGKKIVVVLAGGSVIDMSWTNQVTAVVHGYLSGQAGASAMLEVLTGNYNPSGKLAETYPLSYQDVPFAAEFPATGRFSYYKEGLFVGYRYYNTVNKPVRYPFGFGLSYTQFKYDHLVIDQQQATFTITNSGQIAGTEIAQLYLAKEHSRLIRPKNELKGFTKVYLQPGETKTVVIPLSVDSFRFYNRQAQRWEIEGGTYLVEIGSHSRDIRLQGTIDQTSTLTQIPENKLGLEKYYAAKISEITLADFEQLYGRDLPREDTQVKRPLVANSVIADMKDAQSWLARRAYQLIKRRLVKSQRQGKQDLNVLFIYNMPFRAIAKMTNGQVSAQMTTELLVIVNGHFWRGSAGLIKAAIKNRKLNKELGGDS